MRPASRHGPQDERPGPCPCLSLVGRGGEGGLESGRKGRGGARVPGPGTVATRRAVSCSVPHPHRSPGSPETRVSRLVAPTGRGATPVSPDRRPRPTGVVLLAGEVWCFRGCGLSRRSQWYAMSVGRPVAHTTSQAANSTSQGEMRWQAKGAAGAAGASNGSRGSRRLRMGTTGRVGP